MTPNGVNFSFLQLVIGHSTVTLWNRQRVLTLVHHRLSLFAAYQLSAPRSPYQCCNLMDGNATKMLMLTSTRLNSAKQNFEVYSSTAVTAYTGYLAALML